MVIKRSIGLKKDEYFIERKHVSKNEVTSMLETAGLSKANPYNIVPQGKVNAITTQRDTHRLDMLKEIAGVKIFDDRRAESQRIMDETGERQKKIKEMLTYIEQRLTELNAEKDELHQYQVLDKRREIAEYDNYKRELAKAKLEVEKAEAARADDAERAKAAKAAEEEIAHDIDEAGRKLAEVSEGLKLTNSEFKARTAESKEQRTEVAKLESALKQSEVEEKRRSADIEAAEADLAGVDGQLAEIEARLAALAPEVAAKQGAAERCTREAEQCDAQLQALHSKESRTTQFSTKAERDAHLRKERDELRGSLKKKETQAASLQCAATRPSSPKPPLSPPPPSDCPRRRPRRPPPRPPPSAAPARAAGAPALAAASRALTSRGVGPRCAPLAGRISMRPRPRCRSRSSGRRSGASR